MKKSLSLFLLLGLLIVSETCVKAQTKGLMATFGVATYQMDDMKSLQESLLSIYPVVGEIISSFPPYTSFSINIFKQVFPKVKIGGGYAVTTTGGKTDYTDYSGNIHTNISANSHRLGAYVSYAFLGSDRFYLSIFGRLDANITRLNVTSIIQASGLYSGNEDKYKSLSPNASSGLELMYKFKDIEFGLEGGYLVDFPAELSEVDRGSKFFDPVDAQKILTSDWTGWRFNIKAIYWLDF